MPITFVTYPDEPPKYESTETCAMILNVPYNTEESPELPTSPDTGGENSA
jgi:hypothetical protein